MSTATHTFRVPGISCDHCRASIEQSVGDVPGVVTVEVDVDGKTVGVTGGAEPEVVAAIERAGYDVA